MRVCLGGTFWPFHVGHQALLRRAFEGDSVFVGITDGRLSSRPDRAVPGWAQRAAAVETFAKAEGFAGDLVCRPLSDAQGPASSGDYDAIVVSPETVAGAQAINATRAEADLAPLGILVVDHVMAQDRLPVSSTRIHAGDIDRDGKRLSPVRVAVGSANEVKREGVEAAMEAFLARRELDVRGLSVSSAVPEQPKAHETMVGARARAAAALDAWPEADYAVGVEAGLNVDDDGHWYDVQAVAVLDRLGIRTEGWGPAFAYPEWVTKRALAGERVSDILGPVADDPRIGGTTGAIGFLTDSAMDRTELTRISTLMALVPRWRRELYANAPATAPAKRSKASGA